MELMKLKITRNNNNKILVYKKYIILLLLNNIKKMVNLTKLLNYKEQQYNNI